MLRRVRLSLAILSLVAIGGWLCRSTVINQMSQRFLNTGPNGPETPASVGLAFDRLKIPSGDRILDAYLVRAAAGCQARVAVLIFHGVMETISEWVRAQKFLYDHCVSSLVFDYSGHGDSSRPGTIAHLNTDAISAYASFVAQFPGERLCVLAHSMGNAVMLESVVRFTPAPACIVVASAFSSLRDSARMHGTSPWLLYAMPDAWNNVENIKGVHSPVLVVFSDADRENHPAMGREIFEAAPQPKQLVVLHGFAHNALYQSPSDEWWSPVLLFLKEQ